MSRDEREEVIELSIEETNALRATLGLKPLVTRNRTHAANQGATSSCDTNHSVNTNEEEFSLSIDETNRLRIQLGLAPLRTVTDSVDSSKVGKSPKDFIHLPASNIGAEQEARKKIDDAKLKREVEMGLLKLKSEESAVNDDSNNTIAWVAKMRNTVGSRQGISENDISQKRAMIIQEQLCLNNNYTLKDMMEQNIAVSYSAADFEMGSSTVLTLSDRPLINESDEHDDHELENVHMTENKVLKENLKKKRLAEMGKSYAGGYVAFDDDEFEELGGSQTTLNTLLSKNGMAEGVNVLAKSHKRKLHDFVQPIKSDNDLFASDKGIPISIQSPLDRTSQQTDFMTLEEEKELVMKNIHMRTEGKKRRKHKLAALNSSAQSLGDQVPLVRQSTLVDDLEKNRPSLARKRRRRHEEQSDNEEDSAIQVNDVACDLKINAASSEGKYDEEKPINYAIESIINQRHDKFRQIMEKGNSRSAQVFKTLAVKQDRSVDNDDDFFLIIASDKAQRLARLRESNSSKAVDSTISKGAKAVSSAVVSADMKPCTEKKEVTVTFELDATKEFTRALRASHGGAIGQSSKHKRGLLISSKPKIGVEQQPCQRESESVILTTGVNTAEKKDNSDTTDLESLTEPLNDFAENSLPFGSATGSTVVGGRGLASALNFLKQTGEITGKNAGREEMRGRAKDEKTYEDYERLNLSEVVKLDRFGSKGAPHEKDLEYANREIKLDYRDEFGRLLTRKEAFRHLSYQFHGYGSGKKNQERRLKQIERERVEKVSSSRLDNGKGTLAALKATQRATGKAFVVHKA